MKKLLGIHIYRKVKQYLYLTIGVFIMAFAFYFFVIPSGIVVGGTTGIAMIVNRFLPWFKISIIALICNLILLVLARLFLGKKEFVRSIYGSILYPVFLGLFEILFPDFSFAVSDLLLLALYAGGLIGIGFAIVIHNGGTTGGTDIAIQILQKNTKLTIGSSILVIESSIIIVGALTTLGGISSGIIDLLYAIVVVFLSGKASDMFLIGIESKKALNIITDKPAELRQAIFQSFSRGMTEIDSIGSYSQKKKTVLIMVIYNSEYHYLKRIIEDTDPNAFVYVTPASEIQGEWSSTDEVYLENDSSQKTIKNQKKSL